MFEDPKIFQKWSVSNKCYQQQGGGYLAFPKDVKYCLAALHVFHVSIKPATPTIKVTAKQALKTRTKKKVSGCENGVCPMFPTEDISYIYIYIHICFVSLNNISNVFFRVQYMHANMLMHHVTVFFSQECSFDISNNAHPSFTKSFGFSSCFLLKPLAGSVRLQPSQPSWLPAEISWGLVWRWQSYHHVSSLALRRWSGEPHGRLEQWNKREPMMVV